jgi:hypothetical protein
VRRGWRWKAWAGAVGGGAGSAWVDGFRGGQSAGSVTSYAGSVTSPTSHTSLASVHIHTHHWAHHGAPTLALTDSHHIASDVRVYVCGELRPRTRVKPLARDLCFPIFRGDWRRVGSCGDCHARVAASPTSPEVGRCILTVRQPTTVTSLTSLTSLTSSRHGRWRRRRRLSAIDGRAEHARTEIPAPPRAAHAVDAIACHWRRPRHCTLARQPRRPRHL